MLPQKTVEIAKVDIPLGEGGIGLGLEELRRGQDGRGCVLVSSLPPEGNAAQAAGDDGKIRVGDMICYLGQEPRGMVRTEGLDFEQTMGALRRFLETGAPAITLVLKRLVFRASLDVSLSYTPGPDEESQGRKAWTQTLPMLAGSQLRKELLRAGLPVYSQDTLRFDQPYVTGNCGGEGICGTCLVQVLEGKELLNEKDEVEAMVTRKWGAANWRLSCRVIVGATNTPGTVRFKLMPQAPFTKKKP
jgi:ferredoxin